VSLKVDTIDSTIAHVQSQLGAAIPYMNKINALIQEVAKMGMTLSSLEQKHIQSELAMQNFKQNLIEETKTSTMKQLEEFKKDFMDQLKREQQTASPPPISAAEVAATTATQLLLLQQQQEQLRVQREAKDSEDENEVTDDSYPSSSQKTSKRQSSDGDRLKNKMSDRQNRQMVKDMIEPSLSEFARRITFLETEARFAVLYRSEEQVFYRCVEICVHMLMSLNQPTLSVEDLIGKKLFNDSIKEGITFNRWIQWILDKIRIYSKDLYVSSDAHNIPLSAQMNKSDTLSASSSRSDSMSSSNILDGAINGIRSASGDVPISFTQQGVLDTMSRKEDGCVVC